MDENEFKRQRNEVSRSHETHSDTSFRFAQVAYDSFGQGSHREATRQWVRGVCAETYSPRTVYRLLSELRLTVAQCDIDPGAFERDFVEALSDHGVSSEQRQLIEALFYDSFDDFDTARPLFHRLTQKRPELKRRLQRALDLAMWVPESATIVIVVAEILMQLGDFAAAQGVLETARELARLETQLNYATNLSSQVNSRSVTVSRAQ